MSTFRVIDATPIRQDATSDRISSLFFVPAPSIGGVEAGPSTPIHSWCNRKIEGYIYTRIGSLDLNLDLVSIPPSKKSQNH
jgi:hypothetical protein